MHTYSICCSDSQVKLVRAIVPVQSRAGAQLPGLLVYGEESRRAASRGRAQGVGYRAKGTTILICG